MKKILAILTIAIALSFNVQEVMASMTENSSRISNYNSVVELPTVEILNFSNNDSNIRIKIVDDYRKFRGNKIIVRYNVGNYKYESYANISTSHLNIYLGVRTSMEYKLYYKDSNNEEHYLCTFSSGFINDIYSNSDYISGRLTPNSDMKITINDDIYTYNTGNGSFTFKIKKYPKDTKVNFEISHDSGNKSIYTETIKGNDVYIDYIYPRSTYVEVEGPKNGTVEATIGNKTYKSNLESNGRYTVTYPKQKIGTKISVVAYDSQGHISKTITDNIIKDTVEVYVEDQMVRPNSIIGTTERNSNIKVTIDNKVYTGKSNSLGEFRIKYPSQKIGTIIKLDVVDIDGQKSGTKIYKVAKRSTTIPKIVISDLDMEYIEGYWGEEYPEKIEAIVAGKTYTVDMTNKSSEFKIKIPKQKLGTYIKIKGTDINGYTTDISTYKISNKPIKLNVNNILVRKNTVSGTTEKKAKVKIKIGNKTYNTTANNNGKFNVKVGYLNENTLVKIKSTNAKGYYSYNEEVVETPNIYINCKNIGANSTKVTGNVKGNISGDYIEVKIGNKIYKGKISNNKYSVKIPRQKYNTKCTVRIMGKYKNILGTRTIKVYRTDYVKIGMTKTQVKQSTWGKPIRINTYTSSYGTTEQWVYELNKNSTAYLYFKKGKLYYIDKFNL